MNTHLRHRFHSHRPMRRLAIVLASLGLLAGVTACSDSSGDSSSQDRTFGSSITDDSFESQDNAPSDEPTKSAPDPRSGAPGDSHDSDTQSSERNGDSGASADEAPATEGSTSERDERGRTAPGERSVIQTGNVSLASDDVGDTRFDAKDVIDRHSGEIAAEETGTDEGEVTRVRMEIRVPQKSFDALMTDLSELGELKSATRSSEDVSTQVIDTRSRIKSQERSIARIQSLLASAEDLKEIISIESQLSSRQADLDSLKAQLAWLEDQSSLSTVTLSLSPTDEADEPEKEKDETGFVPGLKSGWDAFTTMVSGLGTGVGAVLPFGVAVLVLLTPIWIMVRRRAGRQRNASPA